MRNTNGNKSAGRKRRARSTRNASRGARKRGLCVEPLEQRLLLSLTPQQIDLNASGASNPDDFLQIADTAYFTADDGVHGRELWVTDGTADGTALLKDIQPGSESSSPTELVEFGGQLYFVADDGEHGRELWKSDGTAEGTVLVCDIQPGQGYQYPYGDGPLNSAPHQLTVVDGVLFFAAQTTDNGVELWKSDGTTQGTTLVKDIATGTYTNSQGTYPSSSNPANLVDVNGTLFFTADDGQHGEELWKSDGTEQGTVLVKDIYTGSSPYYRNGQYYGSYPNASNPDKLTAVDGLLMFVAEDEDHGTELWKSDGTEQGTVQVEDINPGSASGFADDRPMAVVDGVLLFAADDGVHGNELWKSDGTEDGTELLQDINPGSEGNLSYYAGFTVVGDTLFFSANDGTHGRELWKSDGTQSGTVLVRDINAVSDTEGTPYNSYPFYMHAVDGTLYFTAAWPSAGRELWQSDGTAEGTVLVADSVPGSRGLYPSELANVDGTLLFRGYQDSEYELWVLDTHAEDTATAQLTVYVDGEPIVISADIGVYADGSTADVYTTSDTGQLLLNSDGQDTLGEFFALWRTDAGVAGNNPQAAVSSTELFGNAADATSTVQMFVNGQVSTEFGDHVLQDGDHIVLVYGSQPVVSINTNFGSIVVELFEDETPGTVDNFLNYVNDGDYLNTLFHRSDPDFVIQGGGFTSALTTFSTTTQFSPIATDDSIANESTLSNTRGTVAMARTAELDSATSQFYINLTDNTALDPSASDAHDGYTVFGQVLDMSAVDTIASLPVDSSNDSPFNELPYDSHYELVVVESVEGQGSLSGVKFVDENLNGAYDDGEAGIAGVPVFLDINGNGVPDSGDITTTTDADGRYLLQVAPGSYTLCAGLSAGSAATVPLNPNSYTVTVEMGRVVGDLDFGEAPADPPSGVDLLASCDSGTDDGDDLTLRDNSTAATALMFEVQGVNPGAEVRIYADGVCIGSGMAAEETVTITTDGSTVLGEGQHQITATQVVAGVESQSSTALVVSIDTTPPAAIASTAPGAAQVNQLYAFDADSPDEGESGVTYSLDGEPEGMTINAQTGLVQWTPNETQAFPQMFQILVSDRAGNSWSQTVELSVLAAIPAYDDEYVATEDIPLVVAAAEGVLSNDGDDNSGELAAILVDQPAHGSVTLHADGSFQYTPDTDFHGTDGFTYKATAGGDESNIAQVSIEVSAANDAPEPGADAYSLDEDEVLTIGAAAGVLANDSDSDGDTLTATLASQPNHGTVVLEADGSFQYTPDAEYSGSDSFSYTLSDGQVQTDPVWVTLTVAEVLDPPTAVADEYDAVEDETLTVTADLGLLANDTDPDSQQLTAALSQSPAHGTLTLNEDGSFHYTPDADYYGFDAFAYVASDGTNNSLAMVVMITIANRPDPPTAADDQFTAPNDGSQQTFDVLANDSSDPDPAQTLSIVSASAGTAGGSVTISGGSILYTAPLGYVGTDSFTYTVEDTDGLTATANVTVSVDDASNNSLSGYVYVDSNDNGTRDDGEVGVPGVVVTLSGTDNLGAEVRQTAITRSDGSYCFNELRSGTYQLTQRQPEAMIDGQDSATVPGAVTGDDQLSNLVLGNGAEYAENNFGERGLHASSISIRLFLASTPPPEECLLETIAQAEERAGNTELAEAIRNGDTQFDGGQEVSPGSVADTDGAADNDVEPLTADTGTLDVASPAVDPNDATAEASAGSSADSPETAVGGEIQTADLAVRMEITDESGTVVDELTAGESFTLNVYVQDNRADSQGVEAAYVDIVYEASRVSITGPVAYGPDYAGDQSGDTSTPGLIDEAGGACDGAECSPGEHLLLQVPFQAEAAGTAVFQLVPVDDSADHHTLLAGDDQPLALEQMLLLDAILEIHTQETLPLPAALNDEVLADENDWLL